jgi:Zn-dependent protease with chaperone function
MSRREARMKSANAGRKHRGEVAVHAPGWRRAALALAFVLATASLALGDRTRLKPGWNMFSPQQDLQIGQQLSRQAQQQLPMLNDPRVDNYLNQLGQRLAAHAPGYRFPYQYRCVNSAQINAFALPGGFIYINRGVIEAADDEAQLAGVMAHETSHVALRHGTNQASKAYAWQVPFSVLGGVMGNSVGAVLAQLGGGLVLNSVFLKYSRTDESQADILGTQILYDSGYDPRAMAQFLEKIEAMSRSQPIEFFSDHPNPAHRVERVDEEIDKLGGPPPHAQTDSSEFEAIKRYVKSLPPPPKAPSRTGGQGGRLTRPAAPSSWFTRFGNNLLELDHPENWQGYGQGSTITLAPAGGVVTGRDGASALAYGMLISLFDLRTDTARPVSLEEATSQLIEQMERTNSRMRVVRSRERAQVAGQPALSTYLENESPIGGREWDWLVTTSRPEGLVYFICVAPESEASVYEGACERTLASVRFVE